MYGHPRNDKGELVAPPEPPRKLTLQEALMQTEAAMVALGLPREEREKAFAIVRAKYREG